MSWLCFIHFVNIVYFLHGRLLVVFGLEDFDATHRADAFLVGAVLAVFCVGLVDFGLADSALFKLVTLQKNPFDLRIVSRCCDKNTTGGTLL